MHQKISSANKNKPFQGKQMVNCFSYVVIYRFDPLASAFCLNNKIRYLYRIQCHLVKEFSPSVKATPCHLPRQREANYCSL